MSSPFTGITDALGLTEKAKPETDAEWMDRLIRRNDAEKEYGPELGNLGVLRFLQSVPGGPQLAAGAQAAGAYARGDTPDLAASYGWHKQRNQEALGALADRPSSELWGAAAMLPYLAMGPAAQTAYGLGAATSRGAGGTETALEAAANMVPGSAPGMAVAAATKTPKYIRLRSGERIYAPGTPEREAFDKSFLERMRSQFLGEGQEFERRKVPLSSIEPAHAEPVDTIKTDDYARGYRSGITPGEPVVYEEGNVLRTLDGVRRYHAAKKAGLSELEVLVRKGGGEPAKVTRTSGDAANVIDPDPFGTGVAAPPKAKAKPAPAADPAEALFESWKQGGFTYDPRGQRQLTLGKDRGYPVAAYPKLSRTVTSAEATPEAIRQYMADNAATLEADPLAHVGGWLSPERNLVLDISRVPTKKGDALKLGKQHGEKAIFDLKAGQDIDLSGSYDDLMSPEQAAATTFRQGGQPPMGHLANIFRALNEPELRGAAARELHVQPKKEGGFLGAPSAIQSMDDVAARRAALTEQALGGAEAGGALWYEKEGGARKAMNPKYATEGTYTSGINSNQASPARETANDAEIRLARASQGPERGKLTNPNFQSQAVNTIDILEGKDPKDVGGLSLKTGTYADTQRHVGGFEPGTSPTREFIDPVIDTHMGTALGHVVPEGASTLSLGPQQHAWGKGEIMAVAERIKSDPEMLARWEAYVGKGVEPTPHRVQAAIWKDEKATKLAAQKGITKAEALKLLDSSIDSSFSKAAEAFSPSERLEPGLVDWKGGRNVDPLLERLGLLQHPTPDPTEARPVWGPNSPTDLHDSTAAAHGPYSADEQRAMKAAERQYEMKGGKPKKNKEGKRVGRLFTRQENLDAGAVDQEQALKDLALVRMWAEGRHTGGLSWRGRDMPVELPREAFAKEGSGAGAREVIAALERNPGFERLLGPEAFEALRGAPAGRRDVQAGRDLLLKGGLPAFKERVKKHGYKGLLGLLPALTLGDEEEAQ